MPVDLMWKPYETLSDLSVPEGLDGPPVMKPEVRLGDDGDHYHHAFVILETNAEAGMMSYFQVPGVDGDAEVIYTEQI